MPEFDLGHELQQALGPEVSLTSTLTSTRPHSSLSDFPLPGYMSGTSSRPPSRPGEMYLPLPRPQHGFVPYGDRPQDQNVEVIEVQTVGKSGVGLRTGCFAIAIKILIWTRVQAISPNFIPRS